MTLVSLALTLYFALSLSRELGGGSDVWPIYLPDVLAGVAMTVFIQRTKTRESDDSGPEEG
jgi:hypothetical protein